MKAKHLLAAAVACASVAAAAQTLKPGLWEVTQNVRSGSGSGSGRTERGMADMQKQMAAMPPAQRKAMEDAMKKQGVQMPAAGPAGGMTMKVCMTKEMVERHDMPSQKGECKTTAQSRSGNTMKTSFTCVNPASSGETEVTFGSPEAYTMRMNVNTTMQGRAEKMAMEGSGRWLAADCGAVKPPPMPKK